MARIARLVAAGHPHHVTQRGNRRQQVFFQDGDHRPCLDLMAQWCTLEVPGQVLTVNVSDHSP